jgi:hypothetical protein
MSGVILCRKKKDYKKITRFPFRKTVPAKTGLLKKYTCRQIFW